VWRTGRHRHRLRGGREYHSAESVNLSTRRQVDRSTNQPDDKSTERQINRTTNPRSDKSTGRQVHGATNPLSDESRRRVNLVTDRGRQVYSATSQLIDKSTDLPILRRGILLRLGATTVAAATSAAATVEQAGTEPTGYAGAGSRDDDREEPTTKGRGDDVAPARRQVAVSRRCGLPAQPRGRPRRPPRRPSPR